MITTKEQELKALDQIREIVEGLGEGSYIAAAMEGMLEDAKENIENDFALSWKNRAENYQKKLEELSKLYKELSDEKSREQRWREEADKRSEELQERLDKSLASDNDHIERIIYLESANANQSEEIIHLKAKLYDMIAKEDK